MISYEFLSNKPIINGLYTKEHVYEDCFEYLRLRINLDESVNIGDVVRLTEEPSIIAYNCIINTKQHAYIKENGLFSAFKFDTVFPQEFDDNNYTSFIIISQQHIDQGYVDFYLYASNLYVKNYVENDVSDKTLNIQIKITRNTILFNNVDENMTYQMSKDYLDFVYGRRNDDTVIYNQYATLTLPGNDYPNFFFNKVGNNLDDIMSLDIMISQNYEYVNQYVSSYTDTWTDPNNPVIKDVYDCIYYFDVTIPPNNLKWYGMNLQSTSNEYDGAIALTFTNGFPDYYPYCEMNLITFRNDTNQNKTIKIPVISSKTVDSGDTPPLITNEIDLTQGVISFDYYCVSSRGLSYLVGGQQNAMFMPSPNLSFKNITPYTSYNAIEKSNILKVSYIGTGIDTTQPNYDIYLAQEYGNVGKCYAYNIKKKQSSDSFNINISLLVCNYNGEDVSVNDNTILADIIQAGAILEYKILLNKSAKKLNKSYKKIENYKDLICHYGDTSILAENFYGQYYTTDIKELYSYRGKLIVTQEMVDNNSFPIDMDAFMLLNNLTENDLKNHYIDISLKYDSSYNLGNKVFVANQDDYISRRYFINYIDEQSVSASCESITENAINTFIPQYDFSIIDPYYSLYVKYIVVGEDGETPSEDAYIVGNKWYRVPQVFCLYNDCQFVYGATLASEVQGFYPSTQVQVNYAADIIRKMDVIEAQNIPVYVKTPLEGNSTIKLKIVGMAYVGNFSVVTSSYKYNNNPITPSKIIYDTMVSGLQNYQINDETKFDIVRDHTVVSIQIVPYVMTTGQDMFNGYAISNTALSSIIGDPKPELDLNISNISSNSIQRFSNVYSIVRIHLDNNSIANGSSWTFSNPLGVKVKFMNDINVSFYKDSSITSNNGFVYLNQFQTITLRKLSNNEYIVESISFNPGFSYNEINDTTGNYLALSFSYNCLNTSASVLNISNLKLNEWVCVYASNTGLTSYVKYYNNTVLELDVADTEIKLVKIANTGSTSDIRILK